MRKYLLLLLLLSILALWPFFKKGYFESHDGEWMVIRFSAFHQTLSSGQFPVRFVDRLNNNYGYPVLNFLYPLPFYLAEFPKLLGLGFVDSIKTVFVVSTIIGSLAMYWALSQKFSQAASFTGAVVYLYIPYRFVDLYVRGSLGENLAFAFLPLILGSIFKVSQNKIIFLPLLSVFTSSLILSHNVIALFFIPIFIVLTVAISERKNLSRFLTSFILGLFIASFFWIPAIYDLQYVRLSEIKVSNPTEHLVSFAPIINPGWGYGPTPGGQNPLPVQVGIVSAIVFLLTLFFLITKKTKNVMVSLLVPVYFLAVFLITTASFSIWKSVPLIDVIQFPWRLLSVVVFCSAIFTAFVIESSGKRILLALAIALGSIITTLPYTRPAAFTDKGDSYYSTNEDTTTVRDEYLPLWVKEKAPVRANQKITTDASTIIESQDIKPAKYKAQISSTKPTNIQINTIYFPGWQAKVDGKNVQLSNKNKFGIMDLELPQGNHKVIINYARSGVHLASELTSIAAILATGAFFILKWRKQNS